MRDDKAIPRGVFDSMLEMLQPASCSLASTAEQALSSVSNINYKPCVRASWLRFPTCTCDKALDVRCTCTCYGQAMDDGTRTRSRQALYQR